MRIFRKLGKHPTCPTFRGMWIIYSKHLQILLTKSENCYPSIALTIYLHMPYFLRFSFEVRYRE